MTDTITSLWKSQDLAAQFADPKAVCDRASAFERTIYRRNAIEYAAGVLVILVFSALTLGAAYAGEPIMSVIFAMTVLASGFVVWTLFRRGSNLERRPEEACRIHHKAQLERQRDLLRSVPLWYLAPLLPGILGLYGYVAYRVAELQGLRVAIEGIWLPLVGTIAFFAFVGWLNLMAARRIQKEIDALPR